GVLDAERDPRAARGQAQRCVRPRLDARRETGNLVAPGGARRGDQRGRGSSESARYLPVSRQHVRDAMVPEPGTLDVSASAQEAGERLSDPAVRAVLVCDGGSLVGVITRKTLVRQVVATGRDPRTTRVGEIAEPPLFTVDAALSLDDAFRALEEHDLERVPVVEDGRLVGVLSRSVLRRRLAEDEPPPDDTEGQTSYGV